MRYPYHCDTVLQSQYEHATIIYEEITNLYEQPHDKNIDVTHKERPWGSQSPMGWVVNSREWKKIVWGGLEKRVPWQGGATTN